MPGMSPLPGAASRRRFFDYCSRDVVPPVGGASRNRETICGENMSPGAGKVKQINFLGSCNAASRRTPTKSFSSVIAAAAPPVEGNLAPTDVERFINLG